MLIESRHSIAYRHIEKDGSRAYDYILVCVKGFNVLSHDMLMNTGTSKAIITYWFA